VAGAEDAQRLRRRSRAQQAHQAGRDAGRLRSVAPAQQPAARPSGELDGPFFHSARQKGDEAGEQQLRRLLDVAGADEVAPFRSGSFANQTPSLPKPPRTSSLRVSA